MYEGQSVCQLQRCHDLYRFSFSLGLTKNDGVMANNVVFLIFYCLTLNYC